ncbi:hypothetical protein [Glycomyces dulcitolivorans]|uniref:hypothetical protein n=1 Tax=Glycomyces dulcitolivorans TaxID=2200759 RepID=UPI000DD457B8|nr:hypothetical protein [Glycomyces dulcitolivorans]
MDEQYQRVDPEVLVSYLKAQRWNAVATWRGTTVWERGPESDQVLLPQEPHSPSGQKLLSRAVGDIAVIEDRPVSTLLAELAQPRADTQRFRLLPATPSGTIPLSHGRKAIEAIYQVLRDGARTAFEGPSLFHRERPNEAVGALLDRVQLCLTEPGSYIFATKICEPPSTSEDSLANLLAELVPEPEGPSDHQVAVDLQAAVVKAHGVATTLAENGRIPNPAEQGVSGNLCKALSDLGGEDRSRPFDIAFTWGFGHTRQPASVPLHFTDRMAAELHTFGMRLERLSRTGPAVVRGRVISLHIEELTNRRRIQIKGVASREDEQEELTLWVFITEEDFELAVAAHRDNRNVQVEGEIVHENGGYRMHLGRDRFNTSA